METAIAVKNLSGNQNLGSEIGCRRLEIERAAPFRSLTADLRPPLEVAASLPERNAAPCELQIFPCGWVEIKGDEPFLVDETAMEEVIRRFNDRGVDMVIDYEHQTEADQEAPAAGWIKALDNRGDEGLWAVVEWTERARQYLEKREYRYYSPVFLISRGERRLVELLRLALTNAPRLNSIRPIVAKAPDRERANDIKHENPDGKKEEKMDLLTKLVKRLGLEESATEKEILEAIEAKLNEATQVIEVMSKEILHALDLQSTAGKSEVIGTILALKQKADLVQEAASLKQRLAERERDDLIAVALKERKITAAMLDWAKEQAMKDPEAFRVYLEKVPPVVPDRDIHIAKEQKEHGVRADEAVLHVAKMFGNSPADLEKYGNLSA
jgi:phage I-like protein